MANHRPVPASIQRCGPFLSCRCWPQPSRSPGRRRPRAPGCTTSTRARRPGTRAGRSTSRSIARIPRGEPCTSASGWATTCTRRTGCCSCSRAGRGSRGCRSSTATSRRRSRRSAISTASSCSTSAGRVPARSTARRCSARWGARISRRRVRARFAPVRASSGRAGSSSAPTTLSRTWKHLRQALGVDKWSLDGISYGTYVGERYGLAHPSHVSKLVLDSVVPQVGETDLGVNGFAAVRRVFRSICGNGCVADLATVVRRDHLGPQLFDALTFDSIADPTYRRYWNVPSALHAAAHGNRTRLDAFLAAASHYQRETTAPSSTRACTRARSAPTGAFRGAARPRRSPAAPRSSEPQSRGSRPRSSIRSTAGRPRATGSSGSAFRGRRPSRRRRPTASSSCRR